jgi:hypothetical protein
MSFLEALDAAESPLPERRPQSVGEFLDRLKQALPSQPAVAGARRDDRPAPAEDVSVRNCPVNTAAAPRGFGASVMREPDFGPAFETAPEGHSVATQEPGWGAGEAPVPTQLAEGGGERDPPAGPVDRAIPARAKFDRTARTRRIALKSAILLGILGVPAMGIWLLNQRPVAIHGWSRALAPPSLSPPRNAPNSVATAVPALP